MIHYPIEDFLGEYFSYLHSKCLKNWDWNCGSQLVNIIEEVLERFTLSKGYRAFLNQKLERFLKDD